jgi:hypothetical protein
MSATRYLVPLFVALLAACSDTTGPDLSVGKTVSDTTTQTTGLGHQHSIGTGHTSPAQ